MSNQFQKIETEYAIEFKNNFVHLVFGKKNLNLKNIQQFYPQYNFCTLKQTHSDIFLESNHENISNLNTEKFIEQACDAHFTQIKNLALVIKTADCIPALGFTQDYQHIFAIHSGWRGVENQIIKKTLLHLGVKNNFEIFFGPSIQQKSFCVDEDVYKLIMNTLAQPKFFEFHSEKYWIDLTQVVYEQLKQNHINFHSVDLNIDTVTNSEFNSYRREKSSSGRNLSFIVKL